MASGCDQSLSSCVVIVFNTFIYILILTLCSVTLSSSSAIDGSGEFRSYDFTRPTILGIPGDQGPTSAFWTSYAEDNSHRKRREPSPAKPVESSTEELVLYYTAFGRNYSLLLHRNKHLLSDGYFEKFHLNGSYVLDKPFENKIKDHCYYQGHVRHRPKSWAAVSTCNGVSGMIFDGEETHFIEPKASSLDHIVFKDVKDHPFTCGYNSSKPHSHEDFLSVLRIERAKRSAAFVKEPYKSNSQSRYVELVIVNDNRVYKELNSSIEAVFERSKQIANIVNGLYAPLNIYIVLVGVVVWSEKDEIDLSTNGDATLSNFLQYRKQKLSKEHPNDNAQLITATKFDGGVIAKALKGSICTWEFSGGISTDHSKVVGLVATTMAHQLGHNFGMEHDYADCNCPDEKCIMSPSYGSATAHHWSSCSKEYLEYAFARNMDLCLWNKPTKIIGAVCGNGFLESGEECDCGDKETCDNKCCNASNCRLAQNATCATGSCCDTNTCRAKEASELCREEFSECDLPEYCDGTSEFCPDDVYVRNGADCKGGKANCYEGQCKTHEDQCKLLWGSTGKMSELECFDLNEKGNRNGDCGHFKLNETYKACERQDVLCGRLHCVHFNDRLEFGLEATSILARTFIRRNGKTIVCRSASVDLGVDTVDPGLVPNGAKCGENKACLNQECQPLAKLRGPDCHSNCSNNGICDNKGNCHCAIGFEPPYCHAAGPGGIIDLSPVSTLDAATNFMNYLGSVSKNYFNYFLTRTGF